MSDAPLRTFRSDFKALARWLARYALYGAAIILATTTIGQLRASRFPSYFDLVVAPLIAPTVCAVLAAIFYAAVLAFPVKVFDYGIRCYDSAGRYRTVNWSDINAVGSLNVYGLRYITVGSPALTRPITIPTFLDGMPEFIGIVEAHLGAEHVFTQALHQAT
jgi:hypothetical protein